MTPNSRPLQPPPSFARQEYLLASIEECNRHIRRSRLQIAGIVASALLVAVMIAGYS